MVKHTLKNLTMNIARFLGMFGDFSTLYMKGLNLIAFTCLGISGSRYSRMDRVKFVKTAFKIFKVILILIEIFDFT